MLTRPPQHAIDAEGRWIFRDDPGIDHRTIDLDKREMESRQAETLERIATAREKGEHHEVAVLEALAEDQDPRNHRWDAYTRGETRFDVDADDGAIRSLAPKATMFVLRRLSRPQFRALAGELQSIHAKDGNTAKLERKFTLNAIRAGVKGVENGEGLGINNFSELTDADLDVLEEIHEALPMALALAVFNFSKGLLHAEKKR